MPFLPPSTLLLTGAMVGFVCPRATAQDSRPDELPCVEPHRLIRVLTGEYATETFGFKVRNIGDVDADGHDDFAMAATGRDNGAIAKAGAVDVYSSATGALLHSYPGHFRNGYFGNGIGAAGDVDGDSIPDVVAGSYDRADTLKGYAVVFSGRNGLTHHILRSGRTGDTFGLQAHGAGDLDHDGHGDIIVGAHTEDANGEDSGRAYVFSGATGEVMFTLDGEAPGDQFGSAVTGDVYGDSGLFAVGALDAGPDDRGRVFVYHLVDGAPALAFTIEPVESSRELGAYFLSIVGDVDADGTQDIYAGDYADARYGQDSGRVFIHSGRTGARLLELEGHDIPGGFGTGNGRAGDVDGDGHDDILVGSWNNSEQAESAGRCQLFSGADGHQLASFTGRFPGRTFGHDAIGIGDIDGDGVGDLVITNAGNSNGLPREVGHLYFFAGEKR